MLQSVTFWLMLFSMSDRRQSASDTVFSRLTVTVYTTCEMAQYSYELELTPTDNSPDSCAVQCTLTDVTSLSSLKKFHIFQKQVLEIFQIFHFFHEIFHLKYFNSHH